jgi:hypothetical protein
MTLLSWMTAILSTFGRLGANGGGGGADGLSINSQLLTERTVESSRLRLLWRMDQVRLVQRCLWP